MPPDAFEVTLPLALPLHVVDVLDTTGSMALGAVMVTLDAAVHPLLSVTVIEYALPLAQNPVATEVVCPPVQLYV